MSITEHLAHPVINALGWTIIHSLWQVALIALLWLLVMKVTRSHSAHVRYHISVLALLAIPASFVFTFFRQYAVYSNARQIVSVEFEGAARMAMDGGRQFFLIDKGQPDILARFEALTPWVFWLYITGMILFAAHAAFAYSKLFSLKRKNIRPVPEEWMQRYRGLKQKARLRGEIPIWISLRVDVPMVVGFFKPVILLPLSILSTLPPDQVEIILLHELYHIKRKDHYFNAVQTLMEILFFYHPATWFISKRIRKERELRVDEWIVQEINNPVTYARALVTLETERGRGAMQPALAATQSKNQLFTRIKHMMTMKTRKFNAGQKLAALFALVFAFVSVALIQPAKTSAVPLGNNGHLEMYNLLDREAHGDLTGRDSGPESWAGIAEQPAGEEQQTDAPPVGPAGAQGRETQADPAAGRPEPAPMSIRLHDGTTLAWDTLSEKDREEIRKAMEEMRIALQEMNKELHETFHSGEFRRQMQESQEEFQQAMKELREHFKDEEFRKEMQKAGEEYRKAMQELEEQFGHGEAFQQEMKKLGEEMGKAMEELREKFHSEEFQREMQQAGKSFREAMEELRLQWENDDFHREMKNAMEELRKALESLQAAEREKPDRE